MAAEDVTEVTSRLRSIWNEAGKEYAEAIDALVEQANHLQIAIRTQMMAISELPCSCCGMRHDYSDQKCQAKYNVAKYLQENFCITESEAQDVAHEILEGE
jgi:hypothetical protein